MRVVMLQVHYARRACCMSAGFLFGYWKGTQILYVLQIMQLWGNISDNKITIYIS